MYRKLCRLAISSRRGWWAGVPKTSTERIARVRGVMASSTFSGSRLSVSGSMSTNTGTAPSKSRTLDEATKLKGVVITSSPGPSPSARTARCKALVPLLTPTA